jgi:hypothetical protein
MEGLFQPTHVLGLIIVIGIACLAYWVVAVRKR